MRHIFKVVNIINTGLCFIILISLISETKAENVTITLGAGKYQIVDLPDGHQVIDMDNFGNLLEPGKPMLPAKGFLIAIPPGTEVYSVTATSAQPIEIGENYNIVPAPPLAPTIDQKEYFEESIREWQQNYDLAYAADQDYPEVGWKYTGAGALRKYSFVKIVYYPFSYHPKSGRLLFRPSLTVSIDCQTTSAESRRVERLISDTAGDEIASEFLINFDQAKVWYRTTTGENSSRSLYDYVIITTDGLVNALSDFANWKETIGYNVRLETISWISSNYAGSDLPEKIRNFLIDKYPGIEWGIEYVLIVGDINNIPMRYCFPDSANHEFPSVNYNPPSDYYYADLTGNWDFDGDGFYGEYGQDEVDFVPEIYVGRIPYSDSVSVASICAKIINCESEGYSAWKNNALLIGANLNFDNEDGSGQPATDAAYLMDMLDGSVLPPECVSTTMYETQGLAPCPLPSDLPLTHSNVASNWQLNDYGMVTWMGHGNYNNVMRRWWNSDDSDGIPESPEIQSENIFLNADITALDNSHPSIIFSNSCASGAPDLNSLGKNLIKNGGVVVISPARIAYYAIGWVSPDWGGIASIDYFFFDVLLNNSWTVGRSLFYSSVYYYNNFFDSGPFSSWGWKSQQNLLAFQLYGDPAHDRQSVPTAPKVLAVSPLQGEINIPRAANISVTFDLPMESTTINDSTFIVNGSSSGPHLGQFIPDFDEVLFNPNEDFAAGEIVTVVLTTGIKSDHDLALDSSYVWSFITHVTNSTADFDSSFFVSTDAGVYAVYAADLDGDGDIDLATANTDANSVSILLNNGDSTFDYDADYTVGDGPRSIVAADLDNDDDVDIATANFISEDITVLYNNGNGIFSPTRENFYLGFSPWAIVAAEFNGDGFIDLAVTTGAAGKIFVLINDGNGAFPPELMSSYDTEGGAWGVFAADFDGDNDIDLAVTTGDTGTFIILFNDGNGNFPPTVWASYDTEGGSWSVFGADFDGDRDIDLAIVDTVSHSVQFFLNVGNGIFEPVVFGSYDTEGGAWSVFGSDFDGDDDVDLAFAISDPLGTENVSILINNSDSTICDSTIYMEPAMVHSTFGDAWDIVSADFNGDGSLDLAIANTDSDGVTFLMNASLTFEYLPGDVNMAVGTWPPAATGPDVTYLVNFFRGLPTSQSCLLAGFWCSADANGDSSVIGADVTKLVNAFRGLSAIEYCDDYEPAWLTPADLPAEAPTGWPNCEIIPQGE